MNLCLVDGDVELTVTEGLWKVEALLVWFTISNIDTGETNQIDENN